MAGPVVFSRVAPIGSGDAFQPLRAAASVYGMAGRGGAIGTAIGSAIGSAIETANSAWGGGAILDVPHSYTPVSIGIGVRIRRSEPAADLGST